jgi:hypothetical protein
MGSGKLKPIVGSNYFDEYGALLVKFGRALKPRIDCVRIKKTNSLF